MAFLKLIKYSKTFSHDICVLISVAVCQLQSRVEVELPFQGLKAVPPRHKCMASDEPAQPCQSWRPPCPSMCLPSLKRITLLYPFSFCLQYKLTFDARVWHENERILCTLVCWHHVVDLWIDTYKVGNEISELLLLKTTLTYCLSTAKYSNFYWRKLLYKFLKRLNLRPRLYVWSSMSVSHYSSH